MSAPGYVDNRDSHLKRLRRIERQVRGLQRMVEEEKCCIDILTQVSAATRALQSFSLELLEEHLNRARRRRHHHSDRDGVVGDLGVIPGQFDDVLDPLGEHDPIIHIM